MHKLAICSFVMTFGLGTALAQTGADKPKPADAGAKPAAPPAAGAMPTPPDWSAWKWFLGTWKCTGPMTMGGQKSDIKMTLNNKKDLDGFFLVQTGSAPKTKTTPPMKWVAYMTADSGGSRYVVATNAGGTESGTGPATWSGDTLEFTGQETTMGMKMDVKHTWKKVSDKEFTWVLAGTGGLGVSWDWVCKK